MFIILLSFLAIDFTGNVEVCNTSYTNKTEFKKSYGKEVPIISRVVKYDANYNSWYHLTIQNNTKKTIVALEISIGNQGTGKRFKCKVLPKGKYTIKLKGDSDPDEGRDLYIMHMYGVKSVIFSDGSSSRFTLEEPFKP